MRKNILCGAVAFLFLLSGCSTEQSTKNVTPDSTAVSHAPSPVPPIQTVVSKPEPLADEIFVSNDSLIALQLEQARLHYVAAINAEEKNDTASVAWQFEQALQLLDELSYYPDIETSQDFVDLSKTIVEDYERFIRKTGSIDATSSIFALREKLNQIADLVDTASVSLKPKRFVTGTTIPLVINTLVEQHINFFTGRGRGHMENYLRRSGKYFPMIHRIMREEGVPEEIAYLAMIESGLNNVARSWASAVGMWQFIRSTGIMYDLRGTFWYDERRDFEKATRAAAKHLKDLYEDFDDWYLVMAAYNSGPGNVYRAMRRSGSNDFWEMRSYLPRETRNYVPAYIAVAIIGMNPVEFGFSDIEYMQPVKHDFVTVNDCIDLDVLAECARTDAETLRDLNPMLLHRATPPSATGFQLRVPQSTDKELFYQEYAAIPEHKKGYLLTHVVRKRETIRSLARRYGISQSVLAEANGIGVSSRLRKGTRLMIPIARGGRSNRLAERLVARNQPETETTVRSQSRVVRSMTSRADRTKIVYKIKSGDTIGQIAEWFNVRATDIRNWNNLPFGRKIRAGAMLNVWVRKEDAAEFAKLNAMSHEAKDVAAKKSSSAVKESHEDEAFFYIVRAGDTLDKIAQGHGVSIRQIQRWNSLRSSRISSGQKLVLYPRVERVGTQQEKVVADQQAKSTGTSKKIIYIVRSGDTISEIAQAYDVRESELRAWNSLRRRSKIYAGQELVIRKEAN
jgi:membrane-bound lytic murein transglycosylase D